MLLSEHLFIYFPNPDHPQFLMKIPAPAYRRLLSHKECSLNYVYLSLWQYLPHFLFNFPHIPNYGMSSTEILGFSRFVKAIYIYVHIVLCPSYRPTVRSSIFHIITTYQCPKHSYSFLENIIHFSFSALYYTVSGRSNAYRTDKANVGVDSLLEDGPRRVQRVYIRGGYLTWRHTYFTYFWCHTYNP